MTDTAPPRVVEPPADARDSGPRIALVTGATRGIGFEIARRLGQRGLVVLIGARVAGESWREGWPQSSGRREIDYRDVAYDTLFATMVEVIDPKTAAVVTRTRLEQWVVAALPDRRAAVVSTDADGVPYVTILALTVTRPER